MNRDEAQRCIHLGKVALASGDKEKAERLFKKSLHLHPTTEAESYLAQLSNTTHTPKPAQKIPTPQTQPAPQANYTKDQEQACQTIMRKTDYYEILGISRSGTPADIKKAYRALALKLHPDKNQAPSASEAFKKINKAFACLSDEVKRRTYDQTGQETVPGIEMNTNFGGDSEFAEHVFREFFGESFFFPSQGFHRVYRTGNNSQRRSRPEPADNNVRVPFMQLLPIMILLFFSLGSNLLSSPEPFSFHMTPTYSLKRVTENYGIEYFMEPSYAKSLTVNDRSKLERTVERDYLGYLEQTCEVQKRKKNQLLQKANYYKGKTGQQYRDYADSLDMSTCETYISMKSGVK